MMRSDEVISQVMSDFGYDDTNEVIDLDDVKDMMFQAFRFGHEEGVRDTHRVEGQVYRSQMRKG